MAAKPADIQSLLECCICLGECQDPRLLPCAHSMCKHCLEQHIEASARSGHFQCPACRRNLEVPAEGASGFPKNFFLTSLRDILEKQTGKPEQAATANVPGKTGRLECSNKDVGTTAHARVTVYCMECSEYLCSNCEHFHRQLVSESHELQPVNEFAARFGRHTVKPRRRTPRCDQHPALYNDMYCHMCRVSMCMKCCLLKHQLHQYRELDDPTDRPKAKLPKVTEKAEKRYSVLETHLNKLDATRKNMNSDARKASSEVHDAADELRDLVTRREQVLIKMIKDIYAEAAAELKEACKETELHKDCVQSLLFYLRAMQTSTRSGVSEHVVCLQQEMWQQETSLLPSVSWSMDFTRNTENVATVDALLGTVSKGQTVDTWSRPVSLDDEKVKLGSPLLTLTPTVYRSCAGITKIDDWLCVAAAGEDYIWMHNLRTNSSEQLLVCVKAVGMTTVGNNSNTLVITDTNKKIHFITINPQNMSITKQLTKDISFRPGRVAYDNATDRLIIVSNFDQQIVICSKTGDIEKRITVKPELGHMTCALAAGDAFVVLDSGNLNQGSVHWVNQSGDVTHTYDGEGQCLRHRFDHTFEFDGECIRDRFSPSHIVQDSQGRLLVADTGNRCIRLINNQQFSHDLITDIRLRSCLYLDETAGTLYVGYSYDTGYDDEPEVFKLNMYKWPFSSQSSEETDALSKKFKLCVNLDRYK